MEEPLRILRRGRQPSPDVYRVLKVFGLTDIPIKIPYAHNGDEVRIGFDALCLDLPDQLTEREVRVIACACRLYTRAFCIGDLLNWLQSHPHPDYSWAQIRDKLLESGLGSKGTLSNYQSNARSFPCKDRRWDLAYGYHDAVRKLPRRERKALLDRAVTEDLSVHDVRRLRKVRTHELDLTRTRRPSNPQRILFDQLERANVSFTSVLRKIGKLGTATEKDLAEMFKSFEGLDALIAKCAALVKH